MPVIDTHTHFFPQEWIDLLERDGPAHGVTLGRNDSGAVTFACPGIRQVFAKPFDLIECPTVHAKVFGGLNS